MGEAGQGEERGNRERAVAVLTRPRADRAPQAAAERRDAAEAAGGVVRAGAGLQPGAPAARHDGAGGAGHPALRQPPAPAYPLCSRCSRYPPAPAPRLRRRLLNPQPGKLPLESIQVVLEELRKNGNLEWLDKNKTSFLIMWKRPEEWGKLIYQWVSKNGLTNSVFTLYELVSGDDTENEEFHGLDEATLLRALQALQQEHKAEIITLDDGRGVKFF
ncbi:vacuolar protein-sorting-associated protein 25 isoform 1-T1 [Ammospiza maritima maritima]